MNHRTFHLPGVIIAVALSGGAFYSAPAAAATKDFSSFGWMAEFDPGIDLTLLNTGGDTATLLLEKDAVFTSLDPLRIVFRQVSNTPVTKFVIADEIVTNDSGTAW